MTESVVRSREELERLGVYDPDGSDADDVLRILRRVFELGATVDEVVEAAKIRGLGPLAMELMIRPPGELVEFADAAAQAGIDEAMATRLWRAFGFTDPIPGSTRLTSDEVGLMDLVGGAIILLGEEPAFAIARVAGSSAARVGEAISNAFRVEWELPLLDEGVPYSTVVERYAVLARDLLPPFLDGVAALIRRHALAVAYRMWAPDAARRAVTIQAAVGFVDIVASTPMTQSLPPGELAGMLTAFENQVAEAVGRAGGRLVKLIGDEAMFVVPDPAAACAMALDLAVHHDLPPMRVGLACGTITAAYGDYFGATVNLASRLVSVAEPTTVVVDRAVREAAEERFVFEALPPLALKGFAEPVTGYQVHRRSAGR